MTLGDLLPLALAAPLLLVLVLALRRAGSTVARVRELEGFRQALTTLEDQVDRALGQVAEQADAVRRGRLTPDEILEPISATLGVLEGHVTTSRAIVTPSSFRPTHDAYTAELQHATRALGMIQHGCQILVSAGAHHRQLEAHTAIKRGYLNVLHARTALREHAQAISHARDPLRERWRTSRI